MSIGAELGSFILKHAIQKNLNIKLGLHPQPPSGYASDRVSSFRGFVTRSSSVSLSFALQSFT